MEIIIKFKDGTERKFPYEARLGGSYTNSVKYEGAFVIVKTTWDNRHAFPAEDVREVVEIPMRGGRW